MGKHTLIIGGGGIGSATACFLSSMAEPGDRITVVERDPTYQTASSSLSASSIRQQFSTPLNVQLSQFGWQFMQSCADGGVPGAAVGLNERGYLFLGRAEQAETLKQRADQNRALGVSLEEFVPAELSARFPWMQCDDIAYASMGAAGEGLAKIFSPRGCPKCVGTGFQGRRGMFELLTVSEQTARVAVAELATLGVLSEFAWPSARRPGRPRQWWVAADLLALLAR